MEDTDMRAERPALKVLPGGKQYEHYDWGDLDNFYSFGNIFTSAARKNGFKFEIDKPSKDNLIRISADQSVVEKMDTIGSNLRFAGITPLYMAVDEGDLDEIRKDIDILQGNEKNPVFNEDFLRSCFAKGYERRIEMLSNSNEDITPPSQKDEAFYKEIYLKSRMRGKIFNHETMAEELSEIINEMFKQFPELKP